MKSIYTISEYASHNLLEMLKILTGTSIQVDYSKLNLTFADCSCIGPCV